MTRAAFAIAIALALTGCQKKGFIRAAESMLNHDATGWPRFQRTAPPPIARAAPASFAARDVVLLFPAVDEKQVLHWNAGESIRLVLPRTPAALADRVPPGKAVGDLRTRDRELSDVESKKLKCAFGRSWNGQKHHPKEFMVPVFCGEADPQAERTQASIIVDEVLDELRVLAVEAAVPVVSDVRCYVAPDPKRLWCEAKAEAPEP